VFKNVAIFGPAPNKNPDLPLANSLQRLERDFEGFRVDGCFGSKEIRQSIAFRDGRALAIQVWVGVVGWRRAWKRFPIDPVFLGISRGVSAIYPLRLYPPFLIYQMSFERVDENKSPFGRNEAVLSYVNRLLSDTDLTLAGVPQS